MYLLVLVLFAMSSGRRADDSSSSEEEDLSDLTPFQKVVHRDSYRRALQYPTQLDRYAGAAVRLDGIVDQMKLWVKNTATEYDPKREVQTFVVTVYPKTPIKELRVRAQPCAHMRVPRFR